MRSFPVAENHHVATGGAWHQIPTIPVRRPSPHHESPAMLDFLTPAALTALLEVIMIDVALAGRDCGWHGRGGPADQATAQRDHHRYRRRHDPAYRALAGLTTQLLQIAGLVLAGGTAVGRLEDAAIFGEFDDPSTPPRAPRWERPITSQHC